MAATLPLNIPIPQSAAIASFNYTDIAEATGIVAFYGAVHTSGSSAYPPADQTAYYLTTATPYSNQVIVSGATIAGGGQGYVSSNNNFDITFNRPQNIKGYAYLMISLGATRPAGGSNPYIWVSGANIQNSTTSTIISDTINSQALEQVTTSKSKTMLMRFDMTGTPKHFKAGETLRLHFDVWGTGGSTAGLNYGGYGADPQDRDDPDGNTLANTVTTQLTLYVPFLLNTV